MKYTIVINQLVLSETNLDIIDCALLDYLYFYCNSVSDKIENKRFIDESGLTWTWIDHGRIIKDMPLLRIKNRSNISRRLKKIEENGYIKTYTRTDNKKFIRLLSKIDEVFTLMRESISQSEPYNNNNDTLMQQRISPYATAHKPLCASAYNNTTIDNTTNDNNISRDFFEKSRGDSAGKESETQSLFVTPLPTQNKTAQKYIDKYNALFNRKCQAKPIELKLKTRLKTFSYDEIELALVELSKSPWHRGDNDRGWVAPPDFIIKNDSKIDEWLQKAHDRTTKQEVKPLTDLQVWNIASEMDIWIGDVKEKNKEIMHALQSGALHPFGNNIETELKKRLLAGIQRGAIKPMTDMERIALQREHPDEREKVRKLIELGKKKGLL